MAVVTDLRLCCGLHYSITWRMTDVTVGTGDLIVVMRSAVPAEANIRIVAIETHIILDADLGFLMRTKIDDWWTFLAAPYPR